MIKLILIDGLPGAGKTTTERDYHPWDDEPRLIVDTLGTTVDEAVRTIADRLGPST